MKNCASCGEAKPLSEFHQLINGPRAGRVHSYCKRCESEKRKTRYANNPAHRANRLAVHKEWLKKNPDKRERWARNAWLKRRYGMTIEQYDAMLESQDGVCAACGGLDQNGHRLAVDHCHDTGVVRGLLCDFCNRALGLIRNDPKVADSLAGYLRRA